MWINTKKWKEELVIGKEEKGKGKEERGTKRHPELVSGSPN